MYIYEYERMSSVFSSLGASGTKFETEGYKEIIKKRASQGWRYIGFIPATQWGSGHIEGMDLVFEKEQ